MSPRRQIIVDKPLLKTGCLLGEGPLYDKLTLTLHFVDIARCQVLHLNTITSELSVDQYREPISCLALRPNGQGLACAASQGFAILDPRNKSIQYLSKPLPAECVGRVRFNDGACDSKGRFFAGTICSREHNIPGRLYCYDPSEGTTTLVDEGPFTDCNGLGWSNDEKTMFFTDSLVNRIHVYDYDDGKLSNRRLYIDALKQGLPDGTYPDGLCVDSEGCIWSARWGGSKVVRHAKDGSVDFEIVFPTALNVTACCFGGPNDDQLYVTSAHCGAIGGDSSLQERYPDSGDIFVVNLTGLFKGGRWRHEFTK